MVVESVLIFVELPKKDYEIDVLRVRKAKAKSLSRSISNKSLNRNDSIENEKNPPPTYEQILEDALEELGINDAVWNCTRNGNYYHVQFTCGLENNDPYLQYLQSKGLGLNSETAVGYLPFGLFYRNEEDEDDDDFNDDGIGMPGENKSEFGHHKNAFAQLADDFLKSVTSRLTVAQVVEGVRSGSELTFDFVMYTIFAGWIAANGLVNNSPVDIAAAMMIEPVMGTVMAITFGAVIEDKKLFLLGIKSNIISLLICIIVGYIFGMIIFIWGDAWNPPPTGVWPTPEMQVRGTGRGLIYGALMALPSGGAIAVTLLNDNKAALVGVAVASTFLPPFINTGILWALSTHIHIRGLHEMEHLNVTCNGKEMRLKPAWGPTQGPNPYIPVYNCDMRIENALLGCVSMALTAVNIICMLAFAYVLLKIKEVTPLGKLAPKNHKFFNTDIKAARKYNRRATAINIHDTLGDGILKEWAEHTGLDPEKLMSESPEARITQLQTLYDIAQDVENDPSYQSVMKSAFGRPDQANLMRRLTQPAIFGRRKSSAQRPQNLLTEPDAENSLGQNSSHNYHLHPNDANRRGSYYRGNSFSNASHRNSDQILNISSNIGMDNSLSDGPIRGLKPNQIADLRKRRESKALRKSLQSSEHLPYSVWPSNVPRSSRFQVRRATMTFVPRLSVHSDSTNM